MKQQKLITLIFLILVGVAFLNVAVQAFIEPQRVMDFVDVDLTNISAKNSIRSYYGGVNLSIALFCIYGAFKMQKEALLLIFLYGLGFVIGRIYSYVVDGQPNSFVMNWMVIESVVTLIALYLYYLNQKQKN